MRMYYTYILQRAQSSACCIIDHQGKKKEIEILS